MSDAPDITRMLCDVEAGRPGAMDELMSAVYADLEAVASGQLQRRFGGGAAAVTLEPAALVNESFLRLVRQRQGFENRGQFFAIATRIMLRVLVDYQRQRASVKRGGDRQRLTLGLVGENASRGAPTVDVEALAAAIERLDRLDPRAADVVRLRIVGGLDVETIGHALGVSAATVKRDWRFGRAWLADETMRDS